MRTKGEDKLEGRLPIPGDIFRRQPASAPILDELEIRAGESLRCRLEVPRDLAILADHFPAIPVVPAVLQIGWVVDLARGCLGVRDPIQGILVAKFRRLVRPGMVLDLSLEQRADLGQVHFDFAVEGVTVSSGRLSFGSHP
jgi:3-hydroxymyristoyl/3-hydroxydecanoyl-(acyl carrier protein) dehydratase